MRNLYTTLLLCLLTMSTTGLFGQPIFNGEKPTGFFEMQAAFERWADGRDLSQEKGWKTFARWSYQWESRILPDGSFPDPAHHQLAAQDYQRLKSIAPERGSAWSPVGPFGFQTMQNPLTTPGVGRVNCVTFHPTDSNTLWIGTASGGIWKSTDNGGSWTPLNEGLPQLLISDIAVNPQNPNVMYTVTGDFSYSRHFLSSNRLAGFHRPTIGGLGIYKTTDGGLNWLPTGYNITLPVENGCMVRAILVHPQHPDTLLAGGTDGVWRSEDGGGTWNKVSNQIVTDLEFHPSNPDRVFMASSWLPNFTSQAGVHRSSDFGQNWITLSTPMPAQDTVWRVELAIAHTDSQYIYALAGSKVEKSMHAIYRSTDRGQNWTTQVRGDTLNLLGYSYDCFNDNWPGGQSSYDLSLFVDQNDKDRIFVGGIVNFESKDGGNTWGILSGYDDSFGPTIHVDQHQAKQNPLTGQYYFCNDGGIHRADTLKSVNVDTLIDCFFDSNCNFNFSCPLTFETQWTNISEGLAISQFYRIGLRESTAEIIGGTQDNSTFAFSNGQWRQPAIGGDGMESMLHPNAASNIIYATTQNGPLRRSEDGGQSFTGNLSDTISSVENKGQWVTPYLMDPVDPNTIYAGFRNLWKSTDKGEHWSKISDFPPEPALSSGLPQSIRDIEINPTQPGNLWVLKRPNFNVGLSGEVHITLDGGNNWADRSAGLPVDSLFPNDLAIGNTSAQAWIAFSGYLADKKVYSTSDGGQTWQNISYNLPNVPINAIEYDPTSTNNTVYVGTDLGVWYIHDGLTAWQPYSQDLPAVIIYELEIDKLNNKIYAATYGRGVWVADLTEGNVGTDLPAIYQADVRLFPNPNTGSFSLRFDNEHLKQAYLEVVDITGRTVYQEHLNLDSEDVRISVDEQLKAGHYFVRLSHQNRTKVLKMVVL